MFTIKRNGNLVKHVIINELESWDTEHRVEILSFDKYEKALEVSKIWEDAEVVSDLEIAKAA